MEGYYFNTDADQELSQCIVNIINEAKTYIKTGNLWFRDANTINALKSAARRGVAVFVLSNIQGSESRKDNANFDKNQNDPHLANLSELAECGIHVKCLNELHAKFLIADGTTGLIMSVNYTYDSLYANPENGVRIGNSELSELERVFDTIYTYADIQLKRDEKGYNYDITKKLLPPKIFDNIGSNSRLLMTFACARTKKKGSDGKKGKNFKNCNVHTLYRAIVDAINNAQRYVTILSYSYAGINNMPELRHALINAAERGIKIQLLYRNDAAKSDVSKWEKELDNLIRSLKGSAVRIGIKKNHAKCVLTEKEGLMFTANINADMGMKANFELGVRLTDNQRLQAVEKINKLLLPIRKAKDIPQH